MTDRTTLLALAERCEQAAESDRELDVAIARALDWKPLYRDDYSKWWPPAAVADAREKKRSILHHPLPAFTASLDAAIALVPEGWTWGKFFGGSAECVSISGPSILFERGLNDKPALAICAAALRARAAMG